MHLCGAVEVLREGELRRLPSRQVRMLLGYLAVNRARAVGRDELIDAIWSERAVESPEALLKPLLSRLRSAIGADLLEGREAIRLTLPDDAWIDVEALERQLAAAERGLANREPRLALDAAAATIDIGRRGFMPGHDAIWIEDRRRALDDMTERALAVLARAAIDLGGGELPAAERAARELIDRSPLEQSGYELLMRALVAREEPAAASAVFDQLRQRLRDELGMAPSPELIALHDELLAGDHLPAGAAAATELPARARPREDFVGRANELSELRELVRAGPTAARARLVLVTGEAGIGKTELARALAADAAARGLTVLYGRCEPTGAIPYRAFVEALGEHLSTQPEQIHDPDAPVPYRDELAARVTTAVERLAGAGRCLLVLEDLHWSDPTTAVLLGELAGRERVLVVGTARLPELSAEHEIARVLAELRADGRVRDVPLRGLDEEELSDLIARSGAPPAARRLARELHAETGGNPLFARHLLRHFQEFDAWDRLIGGTPIASVGIPATLRDLLTLRVARAGAGAVDLLGAAAVLGPEFDFGAVSEVAEIEQSRCLALIESAQSLGLVREIGAGRFGFEHELIRSTLYEALGQTRRAWLHARAAETIERGARGGSHAGEIAHHILRAGPLVDADRRRDAALDAARAAIEVRAPEDAIALLEQLPDADPRVLLVLGDAHRLTGARTRARTAYRRAADIALTGRDTVRFAEAAVGIADLGFGSWWGEIITTDTERVPLLERAAGMLGDSVDEISTAVLVRLARERYWLDQEQAAADGAAALAQARTLGSERLLAEALLTAHFTAWTPDTPSERLAMAQEAESIGRRLGDPALELRALLYLLDDATELVRPDLTTEARRRLDELAAEAPGLPELVWILGVTRAQDAMRRSDLKASAQAAREAVVPAQLEHHSVPLQVFGGQLAVLRLLQGRFKQLESAQHGFIAASPHLPTWRCGLVYMLVEAGDPEAARSELAWLAADEFRRVRRDNYWGVSMLLLAAAILGLADLTAAASLRNLLDPLVERYAVVPPCAALAGPIRFGVGCADLALGRPGEAADHFRLGAELALRLGDRPNELICRSAAATATVLDGRDPVAAATEIARAVTDGRRIGVPAIVERPGIASGILGVARRLGRGAELERVVAAAGAASIRAPQRPSRTRMREAADSLRARGPDLLARMIGEASDDQLERRFGNRVGQRALFSAMASGFRPEEAHGFRGEISYEIVDAAGRLAGVWTLEVTGRRARARPRGADRPAATVRMSLPTLIRLAAAVINPTEAMLGGEISIVGDLELAGRLTGMFGGKLPDISLPELRLS